MNQEKQVKIILADLYVIDSSFRNYENELRKTILKLLSAKPYVEFDEEFKQQLRMELMARIEELKAQKTEKAFKLPSLSGFFASPKFVYAFSGAMICLLVLVPVLYFTNKAGYLVTKPEIKLVSNISMDKVADNAFGSLSTQGAPANQGVSATQEMLSVEGRGGDSVPMPMSSEAPQMVIAPYRMNYKYIYKGDEFTLDQEKVEVLRRQKGEQAISGLTNLLSNMDFGVFDLSSFKDLEVQTIQLAQDKDLGYSIFINLPEGSISINRNYRNWIVGIKESSSLKSSDIPADSELISVANSFIKKHKINTTNYGEPVVNRYWESQSREEEVSGGTFEEVSYFPEQISITYPLIINGMDVYDQGGSQFGFIINVNIREMKVTGLYNLTSQNYQASMYEAETDIAKILKVAEQGGIQGGWFYSGDAGISEVELGTPEVIYMRFMTYDNYESNELLVPALLFPIIKTTEGKNIFRKNIIVPLAKELLKERDDDYPVPRPMPAPAVDAEAILMPEPMPTFENPMDE